MRIVFMGTPAFAVPVAERLMSAGHSVVGVYTQPDRPAGRGRRTAPSPVKEFALREGLPVLQPVGLGSEGALAELAALRPDAAVVAAYGRLVPAPALCVPRLGFLNVHPSLLPRHRGASPVAAAILAGDEVTGVTVMLLDEGLDTGPVLAQEGTAIDPAENAQDLTARLFEMGAALMVGALSGYDEGAIAPRPQDESAATMSARLTREDGRIRWGQPAELIARMVRAYHPWPGAFTSWNGRALKVMEASARPGGSGRPGTVEAQDGAVAIATGDGALVATRLQLEGRRAVSASEFLAGYPDLAGSVLGGEAG